MAGTPSTFSESWFRIAQQRVSLRSHVKVRRQYFRGERWYVLQDPFNNQFFRLRPAAYEFVARLSLDRTLDSVWNERLEEDPDGAPGQEEVLRLLSQLYSANLLHSSIAPDSAQLFTRYAKRKQRERKMFLMSIMFAKIPLFDPDAFLKRCMPIARVAFSWFGWIVWLAAVFMGLKIVMDNFPALKSQAEGLLAPGNLLWLYVGMAIIKTVHEFGHALVCRRYGGEVHTMGIMFLLFTPIPYMDATACWSFRSRWRRALVGAAGMIVEVFVACLAALVWANTAPGAIHSIAYNMMFVASVSTIVFNANPLLRFDGYYILSDLLDIPNLHQRASAMCRYLVEFYAFGYKKAVSPARSRREAGWLVVFAVSSSIYKVIVFSAILFFLADRFLILGVLMAIVCFVAWVCVPLVRLASYLAKSPRLERTRLRANTMVLGFVGGLVLLLALVPFPNRFRAPGVLQAREFSVIVSLASGVVEEILAADGAEVRPGDALFRMSNGDLAYRLQAAQADLKQTEAMQLRALRAATADLEPLQSRAKATMQVIRRLEEERDALTVRALQGGIWVAPELRNSIGSWSDRGSALGQIVDPANFYFSSIVSQNEASRLFSGEISGSEVKLRGQALQTLAVSDQKVIPVDRRNLPSAAIGWAGGGGVAIDASDRTGTRAIAPFFEVRSTVDPTEDVLFLHGKGGLIRFELPPEPLLKQWFRKGRQLLQNRYGI